MKRSTRIVLVLSGALTAGALGGCDGRVGQVAPPPGSSGNSYTNNQYVAGTGYYHAPYQGWFIHPFNYYEASRGWYRGGRWYASPTDDQRSTSSGSSGGHYWFSGSGSGGDSGSSGSSGGSHSSSISRGGFGGTGSGSSGGGS